MRCRDAERTLALYVDEREPWPSELDAHLAACPTCRDEWAAIQRVDALFARVPLAEPTSDLVTAVLARIEAGQVPVAAPARRRYRRRVWLGGSLLTGGLLLGAMVVALIVWGLIAYGASTLVSWWLQGPQAANTVQNLLQQVEFWGSILWQTALTVVGALAPWLVFAAVALALTSMLAYALTLAWGYLISRVWWPGQAVPAANGR